MQRKYITMFSIFIVFISVFYFGYKSYADKGRHYYEEAGQVVWDIQTSEKVVAITFDDGPDQKYTTDILDLLAQYEAKATFFIVGQYAEKYPEVVLRQYGEGHEIANHTYTHTRSQSVQRIEEELKKTNETIYSITGFRPTLFRPVGGQYTDAMINTVVKNGYTVVMWSWHQDTEDWKNPGVSKIVDKVLKGTKPGDVILFHDAGGDRSQTVKALEEILPALKNQGYEFITISELIERKKGSISKVS
ncbi:polysaccharide deacetylase family protein [Lysinibacillus sp. KU-BSD001]|uniref:polysaccharide deacetylase family protein n=1 Tax=Lysinibacillus sp. KU-BSD001 TaxID=3141328 RepID=UPI0036ED8E98